MSLIVTPRPYVATLERIIALDFPQAAGGAVGVCYWCGPDPFDPRLTTDFDIFHSGGRKLAVELTTGEWVADISSYRQDIIDSIDTDPTDSDGVLANLITPMVVGDVTRESDTKIVIQVDQNFGINLTTEEFEEVSITPPAAAALVGGSPADTITITPTNYARIYDESGRVGWAGGSASVIDANDTLTLCAGGTADIAFGDYYRFNVSVTGDLNLITTVDANGGPESYMLGWLEYFADPIGVTNIFAIDLSLYAGQLQTALNDCYKPTAGGGYIYLAYDTSGLNYRFVCNLFLPQSLFNATNAPKVSGSQTLPIWANHDFDV